MFRCNLKNILTEKRLTISKVSEDTGISRTTLAMLVNNNGKGVQFDTINKLCYYFSIDSNALFSFFPVDFYVNFEFPLDNSIAIQDYENFLNKSIDFTIDIFIKTDYSSNFEKIVCQSSLLVSFKRKFDYNLIDNLLFKLEFLEDDLNKFVSYVEILNFDYLSNFKHEISYKFEGTFFSLNDSIVNEYIQKNSRKLGVAVSYALMEESRRNNINVEFEMPDKLTKISNRYYL